MDKGKGFGFGGLGGLGALKDLGKVWQKAQEIQENTLKMQKELEELEIEGISNNGLVKVIINGSQEPRRVEIAPEAMTKTSDELSEMTLEAMKDAYQKVKDTLETRMSEITQGLNLPGLT